MYDRPNASKGESRREFFRGIAALGAGLAVSRCSGTESGATAGPASASAAPPATRRLIDVHHHFASPGWIKALSEYGVINQSWVGFTPAKDIELMDAAGIDVAFVSQTTPGVWLADGFGSNVAGERVPVRQTIEQVRALTREMNEYGARMLADYPTRFGVLAALALPDIDGSLREIEYALDTLKLQGFGIMTSHGSKWIGDPVYEPIWEELNRRSAVVYTHPTAAPCCRDLLPGVGETTLEYGTDTARAIVSWIMSGSAKKFPNIRWIHSHGGGTLSGMTGRLLGNEVQYLRGEAPPDSRLHYIRQYYYDTRHIDNWAAAPVLKRMVGASQLVFGYFDIPREGAGFDGPKEFQKMVDTSEFTEQELDGIAHRNILRLFPNYARVET
jgi:predicted TIM-barrel fold metal-dependent hydrolase